MTEPEQRHIVSAFAFELGKVETVAIRRRMLGHLDIVDQALGDAVAQALGMEGQAEKIRPAQAAHRSAAVAGPEPRRQGRKDAAGAQGGGPRR